MSEQEPEKAKTSAAIQDDLQDMIAEADTGRRNLSGIPKQILWYVALAWALFQLWIVSPLPYFLNIGLWNSTEARSVHLAFAVFLAFTVFPAFKLTPRNYVPIQDWIMALGAAFCAGYIFLFYRELAERPGLPTKLDICISIAGILFVLEGTRRALGPPCSLAIRSGGPGCRR